MRVSWSIRAMKKRDEIFDFIATDNPQAAMELESKFNSAVDMLKQFPDMGRKGITVIT